MFVGHPLQRALVVLVAIKVAGLVLVFDPAALQAFDLPKSLFSRAVEWLLLGTIALAVIRFGVGILPRDRMHVAVGAFVGAVAVSWAFAPLKEISLYGEADRYLGVTFVLDMTVLYAATAIGFRTRADWLILGGALAAVGTLAYVYAFGQKVGLDPLTWSLDVRERPFATLGHPDIFGQVLSSALGALLAAAALARRARWVIIAIVCAVLTLVVMSFVAVRGVVLGVVAGMVVAGALSVMRGDGADPRRRVLAVIAAVAVLALAAVPIGALTPLGDRLTRTIAQGASIDDRIVIYEGAIAAFAARPLAGYGPDAFAVAFAAHRPVRDPLFRGLNAFHTSAHDWLLQTAATLGVLGMFAQLVLIALTSWRLWRAVPRAPLVAGPLLGGTAAYWAHGLVTVGSAGIDWIPWLAAGAVVALDAPPPRARPRNVHAIWQIAILGIAAAFASSGSSALLADRDAQRSAAALRAPDAAAAVALAEQALRRDGSRASYWNQLGVARESQARWRDAAAAYEAAILRSPHVVAYRLNLARARAQQALTGDARDGGLAAALEIARRAVDSDPHEPASHAMVAEIANLLGRSEVALQSSLEAIRLYPWEPRFDQILVAAALRVTDRAQARSAIRTALTFRDSAVLRAALDALSQ